MNVDDDVYGVHDDVFGNVSGFDVFVVGNVNSRRLSNRSFLFLGGGFRRRRRRRRGGGGGGVIATGGRVIRGRRDRSCRKVLAGSIAVLIIRWGGGGVGERERGKRKTGRGGRGVLGGRFGRRIRG